MNPNIDPDLRAYLSRIGRRGAARRRITRGLCAACGAAFTGLARRRYCSNACRLRALRERRRASGQPVEGISNARIPNRERMPPLLARLDALRAESRPLDCRAVDLIETLRAERAAELGP